MTKLFQFVSVIPGYPFSVNGPFGQKSLNEINVFNVEILNKVIKGNTAQ